MSLEIGQILDGKYRIVRLIGEGGMGAVFEGENARIRRRVAIKVLHANTASSAEAVQRFEREAQAAGRIGSDHILEVLDLGTLPDGARFMVMEYLDGEPLSDRIRNRGRLTPEECVPLMAQVLNGLSAAHGAGIIHRDLKPDNIYILKHKAGHSDYVKIIDFGISKFQPLSGDGMNMTRTGTVMGTPYYMSPEQANGSREADARSDLYSMGVILYEALTGQVPFDAKSFNELLFKIVLSRVVSPQQLVPDLNPAFCSIVLKAMSREVEHRFQSAADFERALHEWTRSGGGVTIPPEARDGVKEASGAHPFPGPAPLPAVAGMTPARGTSSLGAPPVLATRTPGPVGAGAPPMRMATRDSWATSHPQGDLPPLKKFPLPLAIGSGALLLALVGGVVIYKITGSPELPKQAASTAAAAIASPAIVAPAAPSASAPRDIQQVPAPVVSPLVPEKSADEKPTPHAVPANRPRNTPPGKIPGPAASAPSKAAPKPANTAPDFGY